MGKLYVVGLGPGGLEYMTGQAIAALETCDTLCGYTTYIDLIKDVFPGKNVLTTPMTKELERCRMALEAAQNGETVAIVCSGDAGVYGMAGPVLQLCSEYDHVDIEIIPGLSAVLSGAAHLGAPLMHDFAVISLSDLLTPWEKIETRLNAAASADFCICLYNPSSRKRHDYLQKACDIILKHQAAATACGWVRNIARNEETQWLGNLADLREQNVDMFTTVFIGNSQTVLKSNKLITPRGYEHKI